jgi:hypothetical protein
MASHILELRSNGLSYRRIAETLNAEQIPTVRGGHRWHAQTIAGIVQRTTEQAAA